MNKNALSSLLLCITCVFLAGFTSPNTSSKKKWSILDTVIKRGILRVGVTADNVPFAFYDEKKNAYEGIDIDLAKQLAKDMEVELELIETNRSQLTRDILLGKFDVAMSGLPRTMKSTLITNMTTGYFESGKCLLVRQDDSQTITGLNTANKQSIAIGVKIGSTSQSFAEMYIDNADIVLFEKTENLVNALHNESIDVILTDNIEAKVLADQNDEIHAVNPYEPFNTEVLAFAMPPGDKKWQDFLNLWILHQLDVGEVIRLQEKWVGE